MKTLWFFVILAAVNGEVCPPISGTDDQGNPTTTPSNKWGEACDKTCGECSDDQGCDKKTGHCNSEKCAPGWEGDKCTTAMCRKDQCGWYGECVAPNQCRCPRKYTRVIKLHETGHESGEVREVSTRGLLKSGSKKSIY